MSMCINCSICGKPCGIGSRGFLQSALDVDAGGEGFEAVWECPACMEMARRASERCAAAISQAIKDSQPYRHSTGPDTPENASDSRAWELARQVPEKEDTP